MLSKDKLVFDEADLASSDQVGSHIIGSSGAKVTSTSVGGGKEALDVFISGIDLDSEKAQGSDHTAGDIGQYVLAVDDNGDYNSLHVNAAGELKVHDADVKAQLVTLNGVDFATEAKQDTMITALGSVNSELDAQTALLTTIDSTLSSIDGKDFSTAAKQDAQTALLTTIDASLDAIEAVDFATETTLSGIKTKTDGLNFAGQKLMVVDAPNAGFKASAATVTGVAAELAATPLSGRVRIMIQNLGSKAIYLGFDNTVSASNGLRVSPGAFLEMPFGASLDLWAVSESGSQDIRIVEIA